LEGYLTSKGKKRGGGGGGPRKKKAGEGPEQPWARLNVPNGSGKKNKNEDLEDPGTQENSVPSEMCQQRGASHLRNVEKKKSLGNGYWTRGLPQALRREWATKQGITEKNKWGTKMKKKPCDRRNRGRKHKAKPRGRLRGKLTPSNWRKKKKETDRGQKEGKKLWAPKTFMKANTKLRPRGNEEGDQK